MAASAIDLQPLASMNDGERGERSIRAGEALAERVVIPVHRYQCDETFGCDDLRGDALKASRHAAESKTGCVAFCGMQLRTGYANRARKALRRMLVI